MIWFVFLFCLLFRWGVLHRVLLWLGDASSCIQVVSFVWVLTIWYPLGLVLWLSSVLESVLPLQSSGLDLSKDQPRSSLPRGISPKMKGPLLEFQKPVHKNTMEISDSAETHYCFPHGMASLDCNRWLDDLSLAVVSRTEAEREAAPNPHTRGEGVKDLVTP